MAAWYLMAIRAVKALPTNFRMEAHVSTSGSDIKIMLPRELEDDLMGIAVANGHKNMTSYVRELVHGEIAARKAIQPATPESTEIQPSA